MTPFYEMETFGDGVAVIDDEGHHYTYAQLFSLCKDFEAALYPEKKQLILILCNNRIESLVAYLASLSSDNVAMLIDAQMNKSFIDHLIAVYSPDFIWRPAEKAGDSVYEYKGYRLVRGDYEGESGLHEELNLLLSTSGTTGSPKFVRLKKENLLANAQSISDFLRLDNTQRPITTLPMHYSYGLSVINSHLAVGAAILLTAAPLMTRPFWDFFRKAGATSFAGVPYTFEMLKKLNFFRMTLPDLEYITQAGGRLDPAVVREFAEFSRQKGIKFYVMYGQTEATARISYLPPEQNIAKSKSIGIPIPGGRIILANSDGEEIRTPFTEGELVYLGSNVMMGYATSRDDLAKGDELKGVLRTGDMACFDDEGYFYITGRQKRFIKIFGNRVNLDDIEIFLRNSGEECVCGGSDDSLVVAVTRSGAVISIKKMIVEKFGFHHSVVEVIEVSELKRSSSGKIQYSSIMKSKVL